MTRIDARDASMIIFAGRSRASVPTMHIAGRGKRVKMMYTEER